MIQPEKAACPTTSIATVFGMAATYEAFPNFALWRDGVGEVPLALVDRATASLNAVVEDLDPVDIELANRQSLLLAALHTGAIEGLHRMNRGVTLTALDNALDWKRIVDDAEGSDARRQVEAALDSFDYAVDAARTDNSTPVTEKWIREVHLAACAAQDEVEVTTPGGRQSQPFKRGAYKEYPNHVLLRDGSTHYYAPPDAVSPEMHRFVEEVRSSDFLGSHAVVQAAYLHHVFTWIHPFQDGNGRVARVLASVPLLRSASVPFHVYEDQVAQYFSALEAADQGDEARLVQFVADRVLDLAQLTEDRLVVSTTAIGTVDTARLDRSVALANAAERLSAYVSAQLDDIAHQLETPDPIRWVRNSRRDPVAGDADGFRQHGSLHPAIVFRLEEAGVKEEVWFPIFIRESENGQTHIKVVGRSTDRELVVGLDEVHPELTERLRNKADAFLRRVVTERLADFVNGRFGPRPTDAIDGGTF